MMNHSNASDYSLAFFVVSIKLRKLRLYAIFLIKVDLVQTFSG